MKSGYMTNDVKVMVQEDEIKSLKCEINNLANKVVRRLTRIINNNKQSDGDKLIAVSVLSAEIAAKYKITLR